MPRTQDRLISRRVLLWTAAVWPASLARADDEASPLIEIDKPVYASNELVRIWVGVQCAGRIPPESQKGGVLHMSRPDGTREAQSISWPIDGMTDRGWKGGWGPGKSSLAPGRYLFT